LIAVHRVDSKQDDSLSVNFEHVGIDNPRHACERIALVSRGRVHTANHRERYY
jgi:hypothetical protein